MVCRPHSPMIKSTKDEKEEAESSHHWNPFTTWEIFPIYRARFMNLLLIVGIKSLNVMDKISYSLSRINLPKNKKFRNWEIR